MSVQTKFFVGLTASCGFLILCSALLHWQSADLTRFFCYLAVAILASGLKVQLPGIDGTMSVNFLFILLGILELGFAETLALATAAILVQCFYRDRPSPVQVTFNLSASAVAIDSTERRHLRTILRC